MHAVPPSSFRLVFSHAALTLPPASILANDDVSLLQLRPAERVYLDHPLIPPHAAGSLLKV